MTNISEEVKPKPQRKEKHSMQIMNPDWTCEERGEGKLLRDVKVIKHTDIASFLKLKAEGYKTIWTGEGKIALHK